jgi:carbamoyltransferase
MSNGRPWVLGLSTGYHNGAACVCHGDELVVAMQEERLTRTKRAAISRERPSRAVEYCLNAAGLRWRDLDLIVDCTIGGPARREPGPQRLIPDDEVQRIPLIQIPHHLGHAYSVFCTSGLPESDVLVIDGGGSFGWELPDAERAGAVEFDEHWCEHVSVYRANRREITLIEKHMSDMSYLGRSGRTGMIPFRSLGHMFSSAALQIFGDYFEAGKVMALAPFGQPTIDVEQLCTYDGRRFTFSNAVPEMFVHDERWPNRREEYGHLAASVQQALESALAQLITRVRSGSQQNLCYAGGVALNMMANRRVLRPAGFQNLFVIPAAEDSGTAIGAAYYGVRQLTGATPSRRLRNDSLGRGYTADEIDGAIARLPGFEVVAAQHDIIEQCVDRLCAGRVVGWFQGGAEFGPRALGHRSILCDPRLPNAKDLLNRRVKHRESFRPFAPAILAEYAADWFVNGGQTDLTDFMLEVGYFNTERPGPPVPAVVHVDNSGRLQTVTRESNERFYELLRAFHRRTGVPLLVNTSMNIMGEPIVETPRDALWLLLFTGMDDCVIEQRIVSKAATFTSVLDFVPHLTSDGEAVLDGTVTGGTAGPHTLARRQRLRDVLGCVDSRSSFRQIFAKSPWPLDEAEQQRIVGELFRRGAFDVSADLVARA